MGHGGSAGDEQDPRIEQLFYQDFFAHTEITNEKIQSDRKFAMLTNPKTFCGTGPQIAVD